jgi:hypothetical protein
VRVARSARLSEAVRLELRPAEEDGAGGVSPLSLLSAEPVVVPPGQTEVDFRITVANDPRLVGDHTLTIRGTALQQGRLPVISETTVPVTFFP